VSQGTRLARNIFSFNQDGSRLSHQRKPTILGATQPTGSVHFGAFEVNLRSGELRKRGIRVKVHDQPFQVLSMLIARPGELVTREEIQRALWPSGTFVDFENGLNSAVNRLRDVLGDSADEPKFIETVPRRGYRFIAPIEQVHEVLSVSAIEIDQTSMPGRVDEIESTSELSLPSKGHAKQTEPTGRRRWNLALVLTAGSVAIFVLGTMVAVRLRPSSPLAAGPIERKLSPVPIVTYGDGGQWLPAFSPDGTRVAYSWAAGDELDFSWYLEVKTLGSDTRLRLTQRAAASPPGPAWSPDGKEIAFARTSALEERGIFIVSAMGGSERKLRSLAPWGVALQRTVSWSPDSHWIAFSDAAGIADPKHLEAGPNALYLVSPETSETKQLTMPLTGELGDAAPAFSPDGKTIAFVHTTADSRDEIWTIPVQGGPGHRLVTTGLYTNGLTWTADGESIVFDRSFTGGFSLWRVASTGGEAYRLDLPTDRTNILQPTVWHDRLAYETHENTGTVGRVSLNKSFTELPQTPIASTRYDHAGRYSPKGDSIAFLSNRSGSDELWMAEADGDNPRQVTHLGVNSLSDLAWSPDGRVIAVCTPPGKVYVVSVETSQPRLAFDGQINSSEPYPDTLAFSRDGRFLYVMGRPGNRYELLRVPADGGHPTIVLGELLPKFVESQDRQTLFFSRPKTSKVAGAPGIWKRAVTGGPEEYVLAAASGIWDLGPDGIYLLNQDARTIERYSFSGKRIQTVTKLGSFVLGNRMSISPDGRWATFDYNVRNSIEIEMVRGFR